LIKIPLLKIEASVSKASKVMRVAAMQNITTPSVMDVIGLLKNTCAGDESQFIRPTPELYLR
jgi:hypothetical protein